MAFKDGKRVTDKKKGSYIGSAKTRKAIYAARKPSNTYTTVKTKDSRKPSASHTNTIKQSNTTAKNFNDKKSSGNTTRLSNTRTKGDITITRIPFIKEKRVIASTDSDKRFNSYGGNDRVDRTRSLMSLGTYKTQYEKGVNLLTDNKKIKNTYTNKVVKLGQQARVKGGKLTFKNARGGFVEYGPTKIYNPNDKSTYIASAKDNTSYNKRKKTK